MCVLLSLCVSAMEDVNDGSGGESTGGGADTKSMLSDFYGAMMAEVPADEPAVAEDGEQPMQDDEQQWEEQSRQQHEEAPALSAPPPARRPRIDEKLDLDSERFQPQLYVDSLLRSSSMKELLEADSRLVAAKRSLDSDMQMLVYENYNKFISATDMIRQMKDNVDGMEGDMQALITNMATISNTTASIEQQLAPNRERVENLVGVSRLLKRLEFLFELPGRLTKSIEMGAYEQAVRYFRVSVNILSQYSHLKSFADIRRDSEAIIEQLKARLKSNVANDSAAHGGGGGGAAGVGSTDQQLANTAMLIDLMEPAAPLMQSIFKPRTERLRAEMRKSIEMQALALKRSTTKAAHTSALQQQQQQLQQQQEEQERQRAASNSQQRTKDKVASRSDKSGSKRSSAASSERRVTEQDSSNPFGESEEEEKSSNPFGGDAEEEPQDDRSAATANGGNEQDVNADEDVDDEPSASARRLSSASIGSSSSSAMAAAGAAGRRSSASSIGQLVDAAADDELIDSSTDLLQLLNAHFLTPFFVFTSSFHSIVLKPLEQQHAAAKKPNKAKVDSLALCQQAVQTFTATLLDEYFGIVRKELARRANLINSSAAQGSGSTAQLVANFTAQLATFHGSLDRLAPLLPTMQLPQRVQEMEEHAIRSCLDCITELTQQHVIQLLLKLHNDALTFDATEYARTLLKQHHLTPQELYQAYATQSDTAGVSAQSGLPSPAAIATGIRARLEECIQLMQPLLNTQTYLAQSTLSRSHSHNTTSQHALYQPHRRPPLTHPQTPRRLSCVADLSELAHTHFLQVRATDSRHLQAVIPRSCHVFAAPTHASSGAVLLSCGVVSCCVVLPVAGERECGAVDAHCSQE